MNKPIKETDDFIFFDDGTAYDKEEHEFFEVHDEDDIEEEIFNERLSKAQECHCGAYQILPHGEVIQIADCCC